MWKTAACVICFGSWTLFMFVIRYKATNANIEETKFCSRTRILPNWSLLLWRVADKTILNSWTAGLYPDGYQIDVKLSIPKKPFIESEKIFWMLYFLIALYQTSIIHYFNKMAISGLDKKYFCVINKSWWIWERCKMFSVYISFGYKFQLCVSHAL